MSLDKIFKPRNIAVVGASEEAGKVGAVTLGNLKQAGFAGKIYPVNLHRDMVQGLRAYGSLAKLPEQVDLAILCTPAATIPDLVNQCGAAGIGGIVLLTAGFREVGADGRALEEQIRTEAKKYPGLRIIGPNCLGVIVPGSKLNATFASLMPADGRVAFVSQSGALCTAMLDWAREEEIGFSHFISAGNMLDVGMADLIDYLAEDPATQSIILYIESIENARAFISAARACSRAKPIIAYKAGRFPASAHAAASHTGAMAGVDSVYQAAFERAGILRVFDIDDLFDCAELLAKGPRVTGHRLAIVTNAGGPGVMACDSLMEQKGTLAQLSSATLERLNQILPAAWSHGNPVDILGDATPERFAQTVEAVASDPAVDAVLAILTPQGMTRPEETAAAVARVAILAGKPLVASWMGAQSVREGIHLLNQAGIPTARTPSKAVAALMNLVRFSRNLKLLYETPREVPLSFPVDREQSRRRFQPLFASNPEIWQEADAKALLEAYGIPATRPRLARSEQEACAIAREIGFPVVLKIVSPEITHKTDVGGVELNLADVDQVQAAHRRMLASIGQKRATARIEGISVQPMVSLAGGIELIVGAKKDPVFGPVLMVGLGGIAAELFADRALGLPPLNERLARHMLESLHAWPLIAGYRGRQVMASADRLIEILLRFSALLVDFPEIAELDANPVMVRGEQCVVLDARLVVDRAVVANPPPARYAHLTIPPYPEELVRKTLLADGTSVTLRPIRPEDEPLWRELLSNCSRESLWSRFRFMFKLDMHESAIRFCFVDYLRELAVVAEANVGGTRRLLGVARLVYDIGNASAEFAVLVGDPWQSKGLGNILMEYCLENVDASRVRKIWAMTARDNSRMVHLFRKHGFELDPASDPTLSVATKYMREERTGVTP